MEFSEEIRTKAPGVRSSLRTTTEALGLISEELPPELSRLPRWILARDLLAAADRSRKQKDVELAVRQLKQALNKEGWLDTATS